MPAAKSAAFKLYEKLFEPFDDDVKSTESMGKKGRITFVEWYHYIARAWKQFPKGFSYEIRKVLQVEEQLILVVRVTDTDTGNYQEATGTADAGKGKSNYGGATAEAESQALRRAFAKFGLGLEMYMDEEDQEQAEPSVTSATKGQNARMKQLVLACKADEEEYEDGDEPLCDLIKSLRERVDSADDKEWHTGMVIEMLEAEMLKRDMELPDPS